MPVNLANCRQKCSVLLYPHISAISDMDLEVYLSLSLASFILAFIRYIVKTRSAGFLSLASYARKHEFGSKAKVTAIAGKAS